MTTMCKALGHRDHSSGHCPVLPFHGRAMLMGKNKRMKCMLSSGEVWMSQEHTGEHVTQRWGFIFLLVTKE